MSEHELWNELGNLYFLSGEYGQAVHAYRRSIQLDESFGQPYSNLALTYVQQGKYEQAIELYRRSIELLANDEEKAISWNRLGNVFRHLKDYKQAVVAYRCADELDPGGGDSGDKPGWLSIAAGDVKSAGAAPTREDLPAGDPFPIAEAGDEVQTGEDEDMNFTDTWAPIDPTLFQQDVFEALEPGALTTWGDPSVDADDPDVDWPPEFETEVDLPEIGSDDLTRWLPIPEEQPVDSLEYSLEAVDLAAEIEEPDEAALEPEPADLFGDLQPEPPDPAPQAETKKPVEVLAMLPTRSEARMPAGLHSESITNMELDVIVQERPTNEFVVAAAVAETTATDPVRVRVKATEEVESRAQATGAATGGDPARDTDELQEIEAGLAKYKRVVQLNPKNARAWDALGNLHKSAGQYKEALLAYEQAIQNDATKALYHHHLGLVYACEGRMDDAIEAFQRVIELDPNHALAHATLGGYYRKKGLEELAQKHVGTAMKSIFDSENEYNRACLAAICGNTDQALELLRVALKNKQTYVDWILRDPDLDFIRQDPRFKQLISDYAR